MAVLCGNDMFSILVLSTKKRYSNFLRKAFVFQKVCFEIKALKTFKISTDCHIKTCRSPKRHGGKVGCSPGTPGPLGRLGLPGSLGPPRTPGTPGGRPEPFKTPSNPRDPLEPLRTPGISLERLCKASSVASNQTRWYNKRILRKSYSIPRDFSWIENYKLYTTRID